MEQEPRMNDIISRPAIPWPGVVIAGLGLALCIVSALGAGDALCLTEGCALTKDFTLLKLSLWWWGGAGFAAIGVLAFLGKRMPAILLSGIAVVLDIVLLSMLAVTAPCFSCMIAGTLYFALFLALRPWHNGLGTLAKPVLLLWIMAFIPNVMALAASPWAIHGDEEASVSVYFSPSCPACRKTISEYLDESVSLRLYPIQHEDGDLERILVMHDYLTQGKPLKEAYEACVAPELPEHNATGTQKALMRWRLFRNSNALKRLGSNAVPVVVRIGLVEDTPPPAKESSGFSIFDQQNTTQPEVEQCGPEDKDCE